MNFHQYLIVHPMNRYDEYSERDIESLIEGCILMDAEISRLWEIQGELLAALKALYKDRSGRVDEQIRAAIARAEAK